jgi:molecular chaperone DnaK (HSP70)
MKHRVVGIDLGTTYSAVAAYDEDAMTSLIIADETGAETTPSVIGLDPTSGLAIVGHTAKRNAALNPTNTVIEIKREMGEQFTESLLDKYRARRDPSGSGGFGVGDPVQVMFNGRWMRPQEISALTLMRMASIAQREIGEEIRDAVITVPAYFTANQKKATEDAARLAGLYPRQLIPEPTAAAICYGVDTFDSQEQIYLVYDLGGGTFDVSIIKVKDSAVDVVATSGDSRLGGGDFDDAIVHWAVEEARKAGLDVSGNPIARGMLKLAAEQTKILLSASAAANLVVHDPLSKRAVTLTLERAKFESLIEMALQRSLASVARALQYAEEKSVRREALNAVLLVGGSTRVPRVRQLLAEYFNRDDRFVRADGNPDHLVARGAAIVARRFEPSPPPFDIKKRPDATLISQEMEDIVSVNFITEHTLGVGVQENKFDPLISRGTNIPVSAMRTYTNPEGATHVVAPIYQGEGTYVYENTLIGELHLGPMQPLPEGHHQFETHFSLDQNGLLSVKIHHRNDDKVYAGDFRHNATVDGDDALLLLRQRLLAMFQPLPVSPQQPDIPPPPPPPPGVAAPEPAAAAAAPPQAEQAVVGADGLPPNLLTDIRIEVQNEFHKSVVRRTRKQLLKQIDPALVGAYNAFADAVNAGRPEETISELADALEDAYADARRSV